MIAVIDYGYNGLKEVINAIEELKYDFSVTSSESVICSSDKIIFPAAGETGTALKKLHMLNLFSLLRMVKRPLLGIDLGMDLLAGSSESENLSLLGIFPCCIEKNEFAGGVNRKVHLLKESKLLEGIGENEEFFFENNYHIPVTEFTTSSVTDGEEYSATIERNNFYAVQFRPEKSGEPGLRVLKNFFEL
jgi:imidazole glycerol-phosphate synthase subunit HisH